MQEYDWMLKEKKICLAKEKTKQIYRKKNKIDPNFLQKIGGALS